MPMQLTVSRNRKLSKNFNSEGFGVSLTVELDQSLLRNPKELQQKIAYLYHEAEAALDKQAQQRNSQSQRNMSAAQRRVIQSLGQRVGLDLAEECRRVLGTNLQLLDVKQASRFIDHLKGLEKQAAQNGVAH